MSNFSRITLSLSNHLRKSQGKELGSLSEENVGAVEAREQKLFSPLVLNMPKSGRKYTLDIDACDRQLSFALLQKQEHATTSPMVYWSRTLTNEEKNIDRTHREYLAVGWAILLLHPHLEGCRFIFRTDHHELR